MKKGVSKNVDLPALRTLSLCSGYEGIGLGLKLAIGNAARTVCYVEIEAYAAALLAARAKGGALDDAPIWDNLKTFDGCPWRGKVDFITGGYPCQPFSLAGKRQGEKDPRHLWPHIRRIIKEIQPEGCLFENVAGHLSLGYETVRRELQDLGYSVKEGIFSAAEIGAPHERKRLYILALANPIERRCGQAHGEILRKESNFDRRGQAVANPKSGARQWPPSRPGRHTAQRSEAMADPKCRRCDGVLDPITKKVSLRHKDSNRACQCGQELAHAHDKRLSGTGSSKLRKFQEKAVQGIHHRLELSGGSVADTQRQGFSQRKEQRGNQRPQFAASIGASLPLFPPAQDAWQDWEEILRRWPALEPTICGVVDGAASRVDQLRALGNGVVPRMAAIAFVTLLWELFNEVSE